LIDFDLNFLFLPGVRLLNFCFLNNNKRPKFVLIYELNEFAPKISIFGHRNVFWLCRQHIGLSMAHKTLLAAHGALLVAQRTRLTAYRAPLMCHSTVLLCVAVCCSMLQCFAVRCSVFAAVCAVSTERETIVHIEGKVRQLKCGEHSIIHLEFQVFL